MIVMEHSLRTEALKKLEHRGRVPDAAQRERLHQRFSESAGVKARSGAPLIRDRHKL
jgi:hypothetical protein